MDGSKPSDGTSNGTESGLGPHAWDRSPVANVLAASEGPITTTSSPAPLYYQCARAAYRARRDRARPRESREATPLAATRHALGAAYGGSPAASAASFDCALHLVMVAWAQCFVIFAWSHALHAAELADGVLLLAHRVFELGLRATHAGGEWRVVSGRRSAREPQELREPVSQRPAGGRFAALAELPEDPQSLARTSVDAPAEDVTLRDGADLAGGLRTRGGPCVGRLGPRADAAADRAALPGGARFVGLRGKALALALTETVAEAPAVCADPVARGGALTDRHPRGKALAVGAMPCDDELSDDPSLPAEK